MPKKLQIISVFPDEIRWQWETVCQLFNLAKHGYADKARIIVFLPAYHELRGFDPKWKKIQEWFPETKFFFYRDPKAQVTDLMVNYNYDSILRLCCLERHFKEHPELEKDAILYIDSDVLFIQKPDGIEQYIQDDVNYLSDTHTYLNADYFDSKRQKNSDGTPKFVREDKYEEFCTKDFLAQCTKFSGITREICEKNNFNTGGAQYLLKNMTSKFFSECIDSCLLIRMYLQQMNQTYFKGETPQEKEDTGWQSFCADMFAIQWNLWKHNIPSETPKWMDFAWATDSIDKLKDVFLLHNAGIVNGHSLRITKNNRSVKNEQGSPTIIDCPAFDKNMFRNKSPFSEEELLLSIINHEESSKYCTSFYAKEVLETKKLFGL